MNGVHEKDKESVDEAARGLALQAGYSPEIRERISLIVDLVYAKGRLRGYQEAVETSARVIAEMKALGDAPTERPSDSESEVQK